jgi:hypothetical protein
MCVTSRRELAAVLAAGLQRSAAQAMGIALAYRPESTFSLGLWSSRSNLHLSARLLASLQRIMSSLYLRLSDIGTTVASSCQALRTPGPCVTGVCTSGAEPRTLFLAHKHGSVFMQSFDSLTPILHLSPPPSISVQLRHHDRHARAVRQPVLGIKRIDAGSLA